MAAHQTKNAIKGRQGFQRTGRADPLESAVRSIPQHVSGMLSPASVAPTGYQDIHLAFRNKRQMPISGSWSSAKKQEDPETRALAKDSATQSDTLDYISRKSRDAATLSDVARHPNTSPETLHYMALNLDHQDYTDVICRIGENAKSDSETMRLLATSSSEKVKVWAAWHDNTPADSHLAFRDHPDAAVRQGSSENPGNTRENLFYLGNALYEGDGPCRTAAKANRNYPSVEERLTLARDAGTPMLEREMLAWDTNSQVRKAAREYFGRNRPTAEDLGREAKNRGFARHIAAGVVKRKMMLEDKTLGAEDA